MIIDLHIFQILMTVLLATLFSSTFGSGLGLIAMPLLAFLIDLETAGALVAIVGSTLSVGVIINNWRDIQLKIARNLIISGLVGIPIGLYLLKGMQNEIMKLFLAIFILVFSLFKIFNPRLPPLKTDRSSYIFGLLSGILGGAYIMGGPPVIIYGSMRRWPPNIFRATLITYFFPINTFIFVGHIVAGNVTTQVLSLYAMAIPLIIFCIFFGGWLNRLIPKGKFDRIIYILLVFIGLLLLSKSIV